MTRESTSKPVSSALLSALSSMRGKNSALFMENEHEDLNLLICMILWVFLEEVNSESFLEVTLGHL